MEKIPESEEKISAVNPEKYEEEIKEKEPVEIKDIPNEINELNSEDEIRKNETEIKENFKDKKNEDSNEDSEFDVRKEYNMLDDEDGNINFF